jgi:hypothetical protein
MPKPHTSPVQAPSDQSSAIAGPSLMSGSVLASDDSTILPFPTGPETAPDECDREVSVEDSDQSPNERNQEWSREDGDQPPSVRDRELSTEDSDNEYRAELVDWISSGVSELSMETDSLFSLETSDRPETPQSNEAAPTPRDRASVEFRVRLESYSSGEDMQTTRGDQPPSVRDRELSTEDSDNEYRAELVDWISSGVVELSMETDSLFSLETSDRPETPQSNEAAPTPLDRASVEFRVRLESYSSGENMQTTRDPYSGLTSLQREIIRQVQSAGPPPSIYPPISEDEDGDDWIGIEISRLSRSIAMNRGISEAEVKSVPPQIYLFLHLTPFVLRISINYLIEEGYAYCTIDDDHLNIT